MARTATAKETIDRLHAEKFSGSLTIHFQFGVEKQIEQNSKWKPPTMDGTVDLTETRGGA